jgi:hypothetical protein
MGGQPAVDKPTANLCQHFIVALVFVVTVSKPLYKKPRQESGKGIMFGLC